jgi:hypothetical protein
MRLKLKVILATIVCTSIAWALLLAGLVHFGRDRRPHAIGSFWFHPSTNGATIFAFSPPDGDPSSVEWEPQDGDFVTELVLSNTTGAATTLLFSRTSCPPERIWFKTRPMGRKVSK